MNDAPNIKAYTERLERGLFNIPQHMHGGVKRYILQGIEGGSFMNYVFENNLVGAFGKADAENLHAMRGWADFLYNCAPTECWGSKDKVSAWIAKGGLLGQQQAA